MFVEFSCYFNFFPYSHLNEKTVDGKNCVARSCFSLVESFTIFLKFCFRRPILFWSFLVQLCNLLSYFRFSCLLFRRRDRKKYFTKFSSEFFGKHTTERKCLPTWKTWGTRIPFRPNEISWTCVVDENFWSDDFIYQVNDENVQINVMQISFSTFTTPSSASACERWIIYEKN